MKVTVLVTGAGGDLGQAIIKSLKMSKYHPRIISCDVNALSVGLYTTNKGYIVPRADDKNYLGVIMGVCKKEKVDFLFIGTGEELLPLSRKKEEIKKISGTEVVCVDSRVLEICSDKLTTAMFLKENNLPFPETVANEQVKIEQLISKKGFPLFLKPRKGKGSSNAYKINNYDELKFYGNKVSDFVLQEYLASEDQEYTNGVFSDGKGTIFVITLKRELRGFGLSHTAVVADDAEIKKLCLKIAELLDFKGSINIQLRKTAQGIFVFEINPRYSSTTAIRARFGFPDVEWILDTYLMPEKKLTCRPHTGAIAVRYWEEHYLETTAYEELCDNKGYLGVLSS